jgi:signal transduction histidine kinase
MNPLEIHDLATTLNAMLAQLETRMTTTRRFTADAGHELRTPMTSLGAHLETLHTNPGLPP